MEDNSHSLETYLTISTSSPLQPALFMNSLSHSTLNKSKLCNTASLNSPRSEPKLTLRLEDTHVPKITQLMQLYHSEIFTAYFIPRPHVTQSNSYSFTIYTLTHDTTVCYLVLTSSHNSYCDALHCRNKPIRKVWHLYNPADIAYKSDFDNELIYDYRFVFGQWPADNNLCRSVCLSINELVTFIEEYRNGQFSAFLLKRVCLLRSEMLHRALRYLTHCSIINYLTLPMICTRYVA
jgi:hypothetical protein